MQATVSALLQQRALGAVLGLVAEPLSRHPRMRSEDAGAVQLVLTFLRNLLAVPESVALAGKDHKSRLQARRGRAAQPAASHCRPSASRLHRSSAAALTFLPPF